MVIVMSDKDLNSDEVIAVDIGSDDDKSMNTNDELMNFLGVRPEDMSNGPGSLPPAFEFLEKYFPDKDSVGEKTNYRKSDMPTNITVMSLLCDVYPELTTGPVDIRELMDDWIDSFDRRLPSVENRSREEYKEILKSLLAGLRSIDNGKGEEEGFMKRMFTTKGGEDNEG